MPIRTGVDLVSVPRIRGILDRHGANFVRRFFSDHERAHAQRSREGPEVYAICWGAREAAYKIGAGRLWSDYRVRFRGDRLRLELSETFHDRPGVEIPPRAEWDLSWSRYRDGVLVVVVAVWGGSSEVEGSDGGAASPPAPSTG